MDNQPKILLLDNNNDDCKALLSFLQEHGYDTFRANGHNLDEILSSINPDIIIFNNGTDNNAFYQKIKQKDVSVLYIIDPDSKKVLDLEFDNVNYIVKPFFYLDLAEHIEMLLKIRSLKCEKSAYKRELLKLHKALNIASLSGIIAHNINNYLGAVIGYSDILKSFVNGHEKTQQYIEKIIEASQNIADLTQRLLSYSRSLRSEPKETKLKDILDNVIFLYNDSKDIYIDIKIPGDIPKINVDNDQIQLAMANIFLHAQSITSDGNKIVINASTGQLPEAFASKSVHDEYVIISISCVGTSIDQRGTEHALEPFQIENQADIVDPDLLVARNIIERNMGFIFTNNETAEGTTFNVYLPTY